jgi:hypothetical protein
VYVAKGKYVGTLPKGYVHNVPLPRVPIQQSPTSQVLQVQHTIPDYYKLSYVDPTYDSPHSIVESAVYAADKTVSLTTG